MEHPKPGESVYAWAKRTTPKRDVRASSIKRVLEDMNSFYPTLSTYPVSKRQIDKENK